MVIEQERLDQVKDALMQFADTKMDARQATAIAKHLVSTNADPIIGELQTNATLHRSEFAAQLQIIKRKNSDNLALTNQLAAALSQIGNLKRQLVRK